MSVLASVNEFVQESSWISPEDAPAVALLRLLAADLDNDVSAAKAHEFGLVYRALLKRAPSAGDGLSDEEAFLREL